MSYRYQALGPLQAGEGSRAFLGLAIDDADHARPVVIIWVPEAAQNDPALLAKIQRETEHAAKLDHPNIVTVMGFASLDEGNARVVEFADGESLRKIIEVGKKLPARIAAKLICDACTGVHYAHIAGNDDGMPLVHGDLRPETILVSFGGVSKITGYGALAFAPRESGGARIGGRRIHTAPEQIIGGREAFTIPTDVYLLGLSLYEALTGIVPWADQSEGFDQCVLTLPLPPAPPGDIAPELEKVLAKACAKKAPERFQTPLALREAIEAAVAGDIATVEEVVKYLDTLFPESHDLRAARRHTIDAGIADFVRRQWAVGEKAPPTMPMMRAITMPEVAATAPAAAAPVAQKPAEVVPFARPDEDDEEEERQSAAPWVVVAAAIVTCAGIWFGWQKANEPIYHQAAQPTTVSPTPAVPGPVAVDAGAAPSTDSTGVDAGETATETEADSGTTSASTDVELEIDSVPSADVVSEGVTLGHTPWKGYLPVGRRTITLVNKELGLNSAHALQLKAGEPFVQKFTFAKGSVAVAAPAGAIIFIDNVRMGVAPLKADLQIYEGAHVIRVNVGKATWSDSFTLLAGQRTTFNVEIE